MIRLGLCCKFFKEPIHFRNLTATHIKKFKKVDQLKRISEICLHNANALLASVDYCTHSKIGCFRVNSQFLPLKTHPDVGYDIDQLPDIIQIKKIFNHIRLKTKNHNIRLSFHPDQFVVLNAKDQLIVQKSIEELDYQSELSEFIGADVINIHAGGAYGNKVSALQRLEQVISKLKKRIRTRLTIENDDRLFTPKDLLPLCYKIHLPLVYDVHHHRCLPDGLSVEKVTKSALKTWDREPLFHLSSPKYGWHGNNPQWHHDDIDINDFPDAWKKLNITVEVEAKAKELAVKKLIQEFHPKPNQSKGGKKCLK
jgi:UV DNA damage endonuclease